MTQHDPQNLQARKARLRNSFIAQLPHRVRELRQHLSQLAPGQQDAPHLQEIHRILHTLKGSGATFGVPEVMSTARGAEQSLSRVLDGEAPITSKLLDELAAQLETLERLEFEYAPSLPQERAPEVDLPAQRSGRDIASCRGEHSIYVCDDDPEMAGALAMQLGCFGYRVTPFTSLTRLCQAVTTAPPAAVILDVVFPEGRNAGPDTLVEINRITGQRVPTIFMSNREDFAARLHAVQAGGSAYCTKPVKTVEMVEILDLITDTTPAEPFHILIVDDDPDLAQYHALILEQAGMVTRVLSDPAEVLQQLETFKADLVLIDLYMPRCSGLELAQVLRQVPRHISLPIIYVSSETDAARQFKALAAGADGFLTKPLEPQRLVTEIRLRAERMRTLRSLMVRDSLTGLFNHNTILQLLEIAVAAALRGNTPLSFAMIDIDRFKQVNDGHGHNIGDQVLMALGRSLRLRMRESDVVGRYGGEEFAVVMLGATAERAQQVLDTLRLNFAEVTFVGAGGQQFHCSFSAGLAALPDFTDAATLQEAADRALYLAKRRGRNRVECAPIASATPPR
ncbi:GGDEF domain-containing protein [Marichromatium bheemlicum]|uniref:diguanylate cyclase n=1 Tax=Marichromatium bheemlicum TaxID=365339 RepID=A0ABX1I896_9GAMM|nr:diguanylate cyclase [Marichromatium bheemlicum]NKN33737.1 diguanylate cyclase [Marichromatium bheemlicum]